MDINFTYSLDRGLVSTHITDSPGNGALLAGRRCLIRLTFDAQVHDVVPANSAVVHDNVPGPQSHGVPLQGR